MASDRQLYIALCLMIGLGLVFNNSSVWAAPNTGKGPATTTSETCGAWVTRPGGNWCRDCTRQTCYLDSAGKKTNNCYTTSGTTCQAFPPKGQSAPRSNRLPELGSKPPVSAK